jgi:hypothetical protein
MIRVTDAVRGKFRAVRRGLRLAVTRPCSVCGRKLRPRTIVAASDRGLCCISCAKERAASLQPRWARILCPASKPTPCLWCGRRVIHFSCRDLRGIMRSAYRDGRSFCCGSCSTRWYQSTEPEMQKTILGNPFEFFWGGVRRKRRLKKRVKLKCAGCKKSFIPTRSDTCYCSGRCKQCAYRKRQRRS